MNRKAGTAGIKRLFPLCSTSLLPSLPRPERRPGERGGRAAQKAKAVDTKGPKVCCGENVACCLRVCACVRFVSALKYMCVCMCLCV